MSPLILSAAVAAGCLFAAGTYLMLSLNLPRVALGFLLLSNGVNLGVLTASGLTPQALPPLLPADTVIADPLPQAFILTAIVIGMGTAAFLLAMTVRLEKGGRSDP